MRSSLGADQHFTLWITVVLPLYTLLVKAACRTGRRLCRLANFASISDPALVESLRQHASSSRFSGAIIAASSSLSCMLLPSQPASRDGRHSRPSRSFLAGSPTALPDCRWSISSPAIRASSKRPVRPRIYGAIGIVIGEVFFALPACSDDHSTALATLPRTRALRGQLDRCAPARSRIFFSVTLPWLPLRQISAGFVVFTLIFTDFGVPKVIGGSYNVLATDVWTGRSSASSISRWGPSLDCFLLFRR